MSQQLKDKNQALIDLATGRVKVIRITKNTETEIEGCTVTPRDTFKIRRHTQVRIQVPGERDLNTTFGNIEVVGLNEVLVTGDK